MGIIKHPTVCPARPKLEKAPAKKPYQPPFKKGVTNIRIGLLNDAEGKT